MESTHQSPWSSDGFKLYLLGFATLFLELVLIRYLAGNIWNLGYFPNLVLLAVFMGMGTGFIFHHYISDKRSPMVFQAAFFMLLLLVLFVYYKHPMVPGFDGQKGEIGGELFLSNIPVKEGPLTFLHFWICFVLIIIIFALISQRTAKLFRQFKPLAAYSLDIAGSCTGIMSFMLASWFQLPAYIWFIIFTFIFILTMPGALKSRWLPILPALAIVACVYLQDTKLLSMPEYSGDLKVTWSPYQKIELIGGVIFVNGVGHQRMEYDLEGEAVLYQKPYFDRKSNPELPPYKSILILGAGSGNDAAAAIMNGAEYIDAVEIDPVIARLGRENHPYRPYQNPKVNLVVDDGRAFMTHTSRRYDLIIFALTDSVVKVSPMAQLRLENYLFTEEAVEKAYSLLTDTGDVIFYNFYRQPWLVDKIGEMIFKATGKSPQVIKIPDKLTIFKVSKLDQAVQAPVAEKVQIDTPTDDWPFLYLKKRGIPSIYRNAIIGMSVFVILLIIILHRSTPDSKQYSASGTLFIKLAFVFMGIAFMLLETKSIIQFSLLFGTTWLNNSLVFLAVLVLVLAANWTAMLFNGKDKLLIIFLLLLISSLGSLIYPLGNLLEVESAMVRFVFASLMAFSPIFFANLMFSLTFKDLKIAEHIFGWNLIGATIGGIVEYSSMALGYNLLAIIVAACYTMVFIFLVMAKRSRLHSAPEA